MPSEFQLFLDEHMLLALGALPQEARSEIKK